MKTKKSKLLKTISFSSLALLMGIAGTMAFAPLGANPNALANASEMVESTTEKGLITPKADDPVIYTTESGLEIKWGNALPSTYENSLSSGNLANFPYFTTTANSTTYTWVIIGRNSNVSLISVKTYLQLYSTWKANNTSTVGTYGNYYFNNTFESTTPAGSAINGVVPSKSYVMDMYLNTTPKTNDTELSSGCVLCLSNTTLKSVSTYNETIPTNVNGYFTQSGLGLGSFTLVPQSIKVLNQWDNSTSTFADITFFSLGIYKNFKFSTYLTASQYKMSVILDARERGGGNAFGAVNTSGTGYWAPANTTVYVRPAFVMKVQ